MKTVFFGSSRFILPVITTLNEEFELSLVVTTDCLPTDSVPAYCTFAKIPYISVNKFDKPAIDTIKEIGAEVGVLGYFGVLLPKEVLNLFPKGIINIHPSLLPKYRGSTPVQTAIINSDSTSGVTIIKLDEELDHGPILLQKDEPILPTDTAESLYQKYNIVGAQLLPNAIRKYLKGELVTKEQDHSKATYTNQLKRQDGFIDLQNPPSPEIVDRMIRAYYPWPGTWTKLKVKSSKFKVLKLLPNKMVQLEGKGPVDLETFYRGYPEARSTIEKLFEA